MFVLQNWFCRKRYTRDLNLFCICGAEFILPGLMYQKFDPVMHFWARLFLWEHLWCASGPCISCTALCLALGFCTEYRYQEFDLILHLRAVLILHKPRKQGLRICLHSVSCVYELMYQGFFMILHLGTEFILPVVLHTVLHLGIHMWICTFAYYHMLMHYFMHWVHP